MVNWLARFLIGAGLMLILCGVALADCKPVLIITEDGNTQTVMVCD